MMWAFSAHNTEIMTMTTLKQNIFTEKYGLTPTHSEVLEAFPQLKVGKALDLWQWPQHAVSQSARL